MKVLKRSKIISAVISVAILCLAPVTNTYAATPTFGHKYIGGVENVTVWLDYSSGIGRWSSYITDAANNWMHPGWSNPIHINFVNSNYDSNMDFYLKDDAFWGTTGIIAETRFFVDGPIRVSPSTSNWNFTNIYIKHDMYSSPSITSDQALGSTIHEMGHAFGLDHYNTNPYSIMCQMGHGRVVQRVQQTDNDSINVIYSSK